MKCELCHDADAEVAIRRVIDGKDCELYVCRRCAAGDAPGGQARDDADGTGRVAADAKEDGLAAPVPPEIITDLLKKMIDSGVETAELLDNPTASAHFPPCPACGFSAADFAHLSRLGCPACYEHFARQLAPLIRDLHRGAARHVGKKPGPGKKS